MKFGYNRPNGFRGKIVSNCGRMMNHRACIYYKLPQNFGSDEKERKTIV